MDTPDALMCADGCAGCSAECASCMAGGCSSSCGGCAEVMARRGRVASALLTIGRSSAALAKSAAESDDEQGRALTRLLNEVTLAAAEAAEDEQAPDLATEFISRLPEQLQEYWTTGEGGAKIRWCTEGSFDRARRALRKYVKNPAVLDGLVANLYRRACGHWPGERKG